MAHPLKPRRIRKRESRVCLTANTNSFYQSVANLHFSNREQNDAGGRNGKQMWLLRSERRGHITFSLMELSHLRD